MSVKLAHPNSEKIFIEAFPDWVQPISFSLENKPAHESVSNLQGLLRDEQINTVIQQKFYHAALKLINPAGVQEFSDFSISFDPSYETVSFHKFVAYRDGEVIDKLDSSRLKVAQREQNWSRGLYQGRLSVMALIDDLREGDVVEYAFSFTGELPHFGGKLAFVFPVQFAAQKEKVFYRILKRRDEPLHFLYNPPELEKSVFKTDTEWSCLLEPGPAFVWEPSQPSNFLAAPRIEVAGFTDWQEVARMAKNLYPTVSNFNQVPEVQNLIKKWKAESPSIENHALSAVRFVQDQIRYLGLEEGWRPTDPSIVLQRRFGDCKDKVYLLHSLLDVLGVRSTPCLVDANFLKDCLPSPYQFNHVVLRIELGERHFWVDPTCCQEGGTLENLAPLNYEFALPVSVDSRGLVSLPPFTQEKTIVQTKFILKETPDGAMEVESRYHGSEANYLRKSLAEQTLQDMSKDYERFYSRFFGSLRAIKPIEIVDNRLENSILMRESYRIKEVWKDFEKKQTCYFCPTTLSKYLNLDLSIPRTTPLQIEHPINIEETVRVKREVGEWSDFLPSASSDCEAFSYSCSSELEDPQTLAIKYTLRTYKGSIQPEEAEEFAKTIDNLWRSSCWSFSLASPPQIQPLPSAIWVLYGIAGVAFIFYFFMKFKKPLKRKTVEQSSELNLSTEQLWQFFTDPEGCKWVEGNKITSVACQAPLDVGSELVLKTKYTVKKMKVLEKVDCRKISFESPISRSRQRIVSEVELLPISENRTKVIGRLHFDVIHAATFWIALPLIRKQYAKFFRAALEAAEKYSKANKSTSVSVPIKTDVLV